MGRSQPMTAKGDRMTRGRGRPPATRDRVVLYWQSHGPCTLGQIMRGCKLHDRAHALRMLRAAGVWNSDF